MPETCGAGTLKTSGQDCSQGWSRMSREADGQYCESIIGEISPCKSEGWSRGGAIGAVVIQKERVEKSRSTGFIILPHLGVQCRFISSVHTVACLSGDFRIFISLKRARHSPRRAIHGNRPPGATTTLRQDHAHRRHRYRPSSNRARFPVPDTHSTGHAFLHQCTAETQKQLSDERGNCITRETCQGPGAVRDSTSLPSRQRNAQFCLHASTTVYSAT
jgi:hypothetical protein